MSSQLPSKGNNGPSRRLAPSLAGAFLVLPLLLVAFAWIMQALTSDRIPFPSALAILKSFPDLATQRFEGNDSALVSLGITVKRILYATGLSLLVSAVFAVLLSWRQWLWDIFQPTVDLLRSIPVTFFVPVVAVATGSTAAYLPWLLAALPCTLIMLLQIRVGIANIDRARIHVFYTLAGTQSPLLAFKYVVVPEILPEIVAGIRLAVSYAIVVVSVLEYLAIGSQQPGFGLLIAQISQNSVNDPKIFAGILLFGVIGFVLNKSLELTEQRIAKWRINTFSK